MPNSEEISELKIVMLHRPQLDELKLNGSVTINGVTVVYDADNDLYLSDYITTDMIDDANMPKRFVTPAQLAWIESQMNNA